MVSLGLGTALVSHLSLLLLRTGQECAFMLRAQLPAILHYKLHSSFA